MLINGGNVNADAIADISLIKNAINDINGNFLLWPWLKCYVNALSFITHKVVLTTNTDNNFDMTGFNPGIQ